MPALRVNARSGEIPQFTGISAPYESPGAPEIVVPTAEVSVAEGVELVLTYLRQHGLVTSQA